MAAPETVVNIAEKFNRFSDVYSPKIIAEFNDYHFKVARLLGSFDWHTHDDTDEVFLVISGSLRIDVAGSDPALLREGDLYVVPRGVEHRPVAEGECHVLLIEPSGTPNTGDVATATKENWV